MERQTEIDDPVPDEWDGWSWLRSYDVTPHELAVCAYYNKKIQAIKMMRERNNRYGLKESKRALEQALAEWTRRKDQGMTDGHLSQFPPPPSSGY